MMHAPALRTNGEGVLDAAGPDLLVQLGLNADVGGVHHLLGQFDD